MSDNRLLVSSSDVRGVGDEEFTRHPFFQVLRYCQR
jgi:hypothetical protein